MPHRIPQKGRVFMAMPIKESHTDPVSRVVEQICRARNLDLRVGNFSGDELHGRLVEELELAEIVIADLTGCRPNVMYELGFARALGKRVLLISEAKQKTPTDLAGVICSRFDFDKKAKALIDGGVFWQDMQRSVDDALLSEPPVLLKDVHTRTDTIVGDLRRLVAAAPEGEIGFAEVAFSGFLSPLAISDGTVDAQFNEEKRALHELIERGCVFRAIICPINVSANPVVRETADLARMRTASLLEYLRDARTATHAVELAVSTVMQKNLYVIGNVSCIEGFRIAPGEFGLSLRQTGVDVVSANRQLFNVMFDALAGSEISSWPSGSRRRLQARARLRQTAIERLERSLQHLGKPVRTTEASRRAPTTTTRSALPR